jgi:hypothetical protein
MTNLSFDPFQSQGATSGTANVAIGQSTGSQYQGDALQDDLFFPSSGQTTAIVAPISFASIVGFSGSVLFNVGGVATTSGVPPIGASGGTALNVFTLASGYTPAGTGIAAASGLFGPAGCILVQVPTSGNPIVKIPFFNS